MSNGAIASFWDFDWGARLHRGKRNSYPDETILATAYESPDHMKGPYPGWDKDIHFVVSHDFFQTAHKKVASCGNQFELVGHIVRLQFFGITVVDREVFCVSLRGEGFIYSGVGCVILCLCAMLL
jgi:hypothetical protein